MGLIKYDKYQGIDNYWYYKIISYALNIIERRGNEGFWKELQLFVKIGRYAQRDSEMIDFASYVFEDVEIDEQLSMAHIYNRIKQLEDFRNAEDVFEENQAEEPEGSF